MHSVLCGKGKTYLMKRRIRAAVNSSCHSPMLFVISTAHNCFGGMRENVLSHHFTVRGVAALRGYHDEHLENTGC